ncbi:MAG: hypothetical protein JW841_16980 [Deltaproteobacteria bacterium]|nr:hypothetical protein [Deltaproteobacteria bacterium]
MGRDLLYKPPVPIVAPEEESEKESSKSNAAKIGTKGRNRELGKVGHTFEKPITGPSTSSNQHTAYKSAYFTRDTSGVGAVNFRQSNAQALRGAEGAMDLKKVVLPPPIGVESPDPKQLFCTSNLMGLDGNIDLCLESFLGRHSVWAKRKGITVEDIQARIAELERMVADRKIALERIYAQAAQKAAQSVTLSQAACSSDPLAEEEDIVETGREIVTRTAEQAEGMHQRIAKTLGIKRQPK